MTAPAEAPLDTDAIKAVIDRGLLGRPEQLDEVAKELQEHIRRMLPLVRADANKMLRGRGWYSAVSRMDRITDHVTDQGIVSRESWVRTLARDTEWLLRICGERLS